MSLVDIRVDLPAYSRSLSLKVDVDSSILQVKQEICRTCPGQPRPDGQRLIWRGRILRDNEHIDDLWKVYRQSEPRIVHLAVHPSAWSSPPPVIPQPIQPDVAPTPTILPHATPTRQNTTTIPAEFADVPQLAPRQSWAYIVYKHQRALAALSSTIPCPNEPDSMQASNLQTSRSVTIQLLQRNGWSWPDVLDEQFPAPSEGGLVYQNVVIEGKPYLQLDPSGGNPTPLQTHALKVLSFTFTILAMTLPTTPTVRTTQTQSMPIPPNVNQLLQQLGLPALRVAQNHNPIPGQNNPIAEIREIQLRPLLAPFMMLMFRTTLLLYFVAPARKPIFGILILAWMLYEIWQPIRNGLRNGWGRIPQNQPRADNGPDVVQANGDNNVAEPNGNAPQAAAVRPAANVPIRPGLVAPGTLDAQAAVLFDTLANMNLDEEERIINETAGTPLVEPGLGHKIITFFGLLITTLHPAVWNRRRIALRRREGSIRTEANMRNAPAPEDGESDASTPGGNRAAQIREELRAHFDRRPRWIQRYMERVVAEEWVDDSD
ncbi:hypothetical protein B0H34DRAFT_648383 [Crassisporium funariophilum]|nr:hypothetical protein B0H34DRAFT_648383 [Crassisporium funariophilum]